MVSYLPTLSKTWNHAARSHGLSHVMYVEHHKTTYLPRVAPSKQLRPSIACKPKAPHCPWQLVATILTNCSPSGMRARLTREMYHDGWLGLDLRLTGFDMNICFSCCTDNVILIFYVECGNALRLYIVQAGFHPRYLVPYQYSPLKLLLWSLLSQLCLPFGMCTTVTPSHAQSPACSLLIRRLPWDFSLLYRAYGHQVGEPSQLLTPIFIFSYNVLRENEVSSKPIGFRGRVLENGKGLQICFTHDIINTSFFKKIE